jgi:hypothetical protein
VVLARQADGSRGEDEGVEGVQPMVAPHDRANDS